MTRLRTHLCSLVFQGNPRAFQVHCINKKTLKQCQVECADADVHVAMRKSELLNDYLDEREHLLNPSFLKKKKKEIKQKMVLPSNATKSVITMCHSLLVAIQDRAGSCAVNTVTELMQHRLQITSLIEDEAFLWLAVSLFRTDPIWQCPWQQRR